MIIIFGWLVGWLLSHINFCRLLNAKSIFYSNDQFYFKQFGLAWVHSLIVQKFLFQAIWFSQTVLIYTIQFIIIIDFVYTNLKVKTVLY